MRLRNKIAAVTGGNGNLGRAVARMAEKEGATVALLDLRFDDLPSDSAGISRHGVDLLNIDDLRRCFSDIGYVDMLFNVAGGFQMGESVHETSRQMWARMFEVNVQTVLNCVSVAVPPMLARGYGKIVNVGAMSALSGQASMAAYCSSKSTVLRLTESMSRELKHKGINVNCVMPSIIDTPQNRQAMPDTDPATWVSVDDLAKVMCFLASDDANAIHGACVPVTNLA